MSDQFIHQPYGDLRLGDLLITHFRHTEWTNFTGAIAFVKRTGVRHIYDALSEFSRTASVKILVGIDQKGTSIEGLQMLLRAVGEGKIFVCHNESGNTFHPKVVVFYNESNAMVVVGSGNWTEGGLFSNYEASLVSMLNLGELEDRGLFNSIISTLETWSDTNLIARPLTQEFINDLSSAGYIVSEAQMRTDYSGRAADAGSSYVVDQSSTEESLFSRVSVRHAPRIRMPLTDEPAEMPAEAVDELFEVLPIESVPPQYGGYTGFVMTLQRTDVGIGQTTAGTARRSPEIFIPLIARDFDPEFWGWRNLFQEDNTKPGKFDRFGVRMRVGTEIVSVNMMTWPDKSDFRIRSEAIRSAGNVGDVLRIERADGNRGFSYYVEVVPIGTSEYESYLELCVNPVRNSRKQWGYY